MTGNTELAWKRPPSIHHVAQIILDSVTLEDSQVLDLERQLAMMGLLVPDVGLQCRVLPRGDAERRVARVPAELPPVRKGLVDPPRGARLDGVHQIGEGHGRRVLEVEVDVVPGAAGAKELGATSPDGKWTVIEVECLGACGFATPVLVNDDFIESVKPERVADLVKKYR